MQNHYTCHCPLNKIKIGVNPLPLLTMAFTCLSRNSSTLMDGEEKEKEENTRQNKFQKATQVWPGLWWQSPLSTLTREVGLPGPGRCQEGPHSTGCRCCPSPGSPRPLHWARCQGISLASRQGAQSCGSAWRPAPKKAAVHA